MILHLLSFYLKKSTGIRKVRDLYEFVVHREEIKEFLADLESFQREGGEIDVLNPHLNEKYDFAGAASGHYFWQDLVVAQWVLAQKKNRIADVGSRLDGYVVHVAASRKISVIDIRPIKKRIPNVEFIKADILDFKGRNKFEIVTSLHTLEHIGLGRYGDPIDPKGHVLCFDALAKLLLPKGQLVVSFPIDSKTRVEFNGQRMIGIREPLEWAGRNNLEFKQFMYLDSKDEFTTMSDESDLVDFVPQRGALGIYFFRKMN